mgnify:CR=1 FL=1
MMVKTTLFVFAFALALFAGCVGTTPTPPQAPQAAEVVPPDHFCRSILVEGRKDRAVGVRGKYWPNGATLKVKLLNGSAARRAYFTNAALEWEKIVNLKFSYVTTGAADIRVGFWDGEGSWSYIGTDAKQETGQANPTINIGWSGSDVCLHELGHALGMAHEQASPKSDIQWNKPVVYAALGGPPNNWSAATVDWNVFRKMTATEADATTFDPASIMQYSVPAAWTFNYPSGIPGGKTLSALDKSFMAGVYPGAIVPPPPPTGIVSLPKWQRDSIQKWMGAAK